MTDDDFDVTFDHEDSIYVARWKEENWVTGHGDTREAAIEMCKDNIIDSRDI